ncbi:MAG: hypothetical protein A3J59_00965 [Candidatus Buchananbacteria bacterium RIFCSPHIGHO2_02_FULL_56_16]|uniref:Type 4 fimbrial biogenesis protein PilX N-terminal domain-containing protein n=1 Tax=Candidatus Buchananbacteria bacterium RIFCSPHIGHO2_02_FULL_56_16 TaxID=1797542 RepID=A0A1G1YCM9_9BACT|nr:MAG: hypothetical protein A3J59_00965 [Candidatus Buchananbacteria bacterium RIFCSPHIGHO2_02_FULL_56_16]
MPRTSEQSGIVLILALLIITAALTATAVFGNLIIRSIQQSRLVDQSMQAYYLAESGVERALYQVRRRSAIHNCSIAIPSASCNVRGYCDSANSLACVTSGPGGLAAGMPSDWLVSALSEQSVVKRLQPGESFQIDLFHPYQPTVAQGLVPSLEVVQVTSADLASGFTLYGQLTNLTWLISATLNPNCPLGEPIVANGFITGVRNDQLGLAAAAVSGLAGADLNASCLYILRLSNPLTQPAGLFTISLHSDSPASEDNRVDIPSRLLITVTADFGQSFQTVKVRTPVRPPISGLYDFVLFSDTEIIK